jgi:hypothetical protein
MVGLEGVRDIWRKWVRALVVGVILALGSYIVNDGIDRREQYLSDRDALVSFNVERKFNWVILEVLSRAQQKYKPTDDPGFISGYRPLRFSQAYLVLNTTAIVTRDHEFAKAMNRYILDGELLASELWELTELNRSLFRKSAWAKEKIKTIFGEKGTLGLFQGAERKLECLIDSDYHWSNRDVWSRLDRSVFDVIESGINDLDNLILESQQEAGREKSEPQQ